MNNLIKLALCMFFLPLNATLDLPCILHIYEDGQMDLEFNGHYNQIEYVDHSDKCPCHEYIIDPCDHYLEMGILG